MLPVVLHCLFCQVAVTYKFTETIIHKAPNVFGGLDCRQTSLDTSNVIPSRWNTFGVFCNFLVEISKNFPERSITASVVPGYMVDLNQGPCCCSPLPTASNV